MRKVEDFSSTWEDENVYKMRQLQQNRELSVGFKAMNSFWTA